MTFIRSLLRHDYLGILKNYQSFYKIKTFQSRIVFDVKINKTTEINVIYKRFFVVSSRHLNMDGRKNNQLMHHGYFKDADKNKETFIEAIHIYKTKEKHLRGHVEFILSALKHLEDYGVHRELSVYKELIDIMPKGKMIPRNMWQMEFMHYPKHQECAVYVIEKMGNNGVLGDTEFYLILRNIFGEWGGPTQKLKRMMYWLPKFKFASPWPLPQTLPDETLELSKLAIQQITSIEPATKITVMETASVENSIDDTWIVSATSPSQTELLNQHSTDQPIKVEGPFGVYLHDQKISYFILRAEPPPAIPPRTSEELDNISLIYCWLTEPKPDNPVQLIKTRTVHEQDDGIIMAVCATGTSSRDSLLSWIRLLGVDHPRLNEIAILFPQTSPIGSIITLNELPSDSLSTV